MSVILKPVISEKSLAMAAIGQYTFEVDKRTNVNEIKKSINRYFNVDVVDVRVMTVTGNKIRRRRGYGNTRSWKKAIVRLSPKQKIAGFEIDTPEAKDESDKSQKETKQPAANKVVNK